MYFTLPWARMINKGDAVRIRAELKPRMDCQCVEGRGGKLRGDVAENGIKDLRLGRRRDEGIRLSC